MGKAYHEYPHGVREAAWKRGHMTALEALRVGAWKQAMVPASLSVNNEGQIEAVTEEVMKTISVATKWPSLIGNTNAPFWATYRTVVAQAVGAKKSGTGLYGLDGVEYPVASALLCILDPERWPVIDQHAVRAVFEPRADGREHPSNTWYCATVYTAYAQHLATVGDACWGPGLSIHEIDEQAMAVGKARGPYPTGWYQIPLPKC